MSSQEVASQQPAPRKKNVPPPAKSATTRKLETATKIVKPKARTVMLGIKRGRHSNDWIWGMLLYRVRNGGYPVGLTQRTMHNLEIHPKMSMAKAAIRAEKKGKTYDHQSAVRNLKKRTS